MLVEFSLSLTLGKKMVISYTVQFNKHVTAQLCCPKLYFLMLMFIKNDPCTTNAPQAKPMT